MRFLRSIRKRYWIWKSQNGFCSICNEPLGNDFEIDHVKAFARGGETVRENLQAVHIGCNRKKGSGMPLIYLKRPDNDKRPETLEGIELVVSRYKGGEASTSAMFPPRWGKSTIIRGAALELRASSAPTSIVLAPWALLAEQIKDTDDVRDMYRRYSIQHDVEFTVKRVLALPTDEWWNLTDGIPTLISMTLPLAYRNKGQFLEGISLLCRRSGVRIPVFADEAHLLKMAKIWGPFALEIVEAGGYLVPLTGTPVAGMPGFDEDGEWQDAAKTMKVRRIVDGKEKWFDETYEGRSRKVEVNADVHVTWRRAWEVGALTRANGIWLDFEVKDDSGDTIGKLSELTKDQLSGKLREIIESDDCVDKGAQLFVERLLAWKRKNKKAQGLVITGFDFENDKGGGHNRHARALKVAIEEYLSKSGYKEPVRIEIATGVNADGEPDNDAAKKIFEYRKGKVDILIVKMMGLVGLDVPPLKVQLYMGMPRNGPLALQALSRVLTVWSDMEGTAADMIMTKDPAMVELWQRMVTEQGGLSSSDMVLVDSVETDPPEEPPKPDYSVTNGHVGGYIDEDGRLFDGDHEYLLRVIKDKYITRNLTDAEILSNYENGGYAVSQSEIDTCKATHANGFTGIRDMDADLPKLKGAFGAAAKKIVNRRFNYGQNRVGWSAALEQVQGKAKELCGVRIAVTKIDDAALLRKLIDTLPQAERIIFGNG